MVTMSSWIRTNRSRKCKMICGAWLLEMDMTEGRPVSKEERQQIMEAWAKWSRETFGLPQQYVEDRARVPVAEKEF